MSLIQRNGHGHAVAVFRAPRHHAKENPAHADEQAPPDVVMRRVAWFEDQLDLDPNTLVFIDETGASTKMARRQATPFSINPVRQGVLGATSPPGHGP